MCNKCRKGYGQGGWERDPEGNDEFCRWCSQGTLSYSNYLFNYYTGRKALSYPNKLLNFPGKKLFRNQIKKLFKYPSRKNLDHI